MGNSESSYDDTHDEILHPPPFYAGSSMDPTHRGKQHPTYIADNFNSLDEVQIIPRLLIDLTFV